VGRAKAIPKIWGKKMRSQEYNLYALARVILIVGVGALLFFGTLGQISLTKSGGDYNKDGKHFNAQQVTLEINISRGVIPMAYANLLGLGLLGMGSVYGFYFVLRLILCSES